MNKKKLISEAMRELGKRKKRMSERAIEQRRAANRASVKARSDAAQVERGQQTEHLDEIAAEIKRLNIRNGFVV
jgi:hypothetical protein